MDPAAVSMSMLRAAVLLLAVTAAGGALMAMIRFGGADRPPSALTMLHGVLAAGALALILYAAVAFGIPALAVAGTAILLVAALVGTVINLMFHSKMLPLPKPAVLAHGAGALAGFGLLLAAILR